MRLISFSLTTEQFIARTKTVTRRLGWKTLKAGDRLMGVEKAMGLKPGQKVKRLGAIKVISARREPLDAITASDVVLEGFPGMTPEEFVAMFCRGMRCTPKTEVTRIEFQYLEGGESMDRRVLIRTDKDDGSELKVTHGPSGAAALLRIATHLDITLDQVVDRLKAGETVETDFALYRYELDT